MNIKKIITALITISIIVLYHPTMQVVAAELVEEADEVATTEDSETISEEVSALNHITNEMLQAAPTEEIIYPEFMKFLGAAAKGEIMICGHVAAFDLSFLCKTLGRLGITANFRFVDTRQLATQISELTHHSLAAVAEYFNVPHEHAHQAKEDALTSGQIFCKMLERNRNI